MWLKSLRLIGANRLNGILWLLLLLVVARRCESQEPPKPLPEKYRRVAEAIRTMKGLPEGRGQQELAGAEYFREFVPDTKLVVRDLVNTVRSKGDWQFEEGLGGWKTNTKGKVAEKWGSLVLMDEGASVNVPVNLDAGQYFLRILASTGTPSSAKLAWKGGGNQTDSVPIELKAGYGEYRIPFTSNQALSGIELINSVKGEGFALHGVELLRAPPDNEISSELDSVILRLVELTSTPVPNSSNRQPRLVPRDHRSELIVQLNLEGNIEESVNWFQSYLAEKGFQQKAVVATLGLFLIDVTKAVAADATTDVQPLAGPSPQDRLSELVAELQRNEHVRAASLNSLIYSSALPPPVYNPVSVRRSDNGRSCEWDWLRNQDDGNWGLKRMGFPSAWNFRHAIERRNPRYKVPVAIVDVGFNDHRDLLFEYANGVFDEAKRPHDHGNHVLGILAGGWNDFGVAGCTPFTRNLASPLLRLQPGQLERTDPIAVAMWHLLVNLELLRDHPEVRVVNVSLGYAWERAENINHEVSLDERRLDIEHQGRLMLETIKYLNETRPHGLIVVSAAGNESTRNNPFDASLASPLNWAALNSETPAMNIIVVESLDRNDKLAESSCRHGCVSAPGVGVLSTSAESDEGFVVMSGTSMAAPHVTGLIALMIAYNPDLTVDRIVDILGARARPATTIPASMPNAFDALVLCRDESLHDLADLTGNDRVDMEDFQAFKSALQQIETSTITSDLNDDGAAFPLNPAYESLFPRADLNGDGILSRTAKRVVPRMGDAPVTDLEVMMKAWQDTTQPAAGLLGLLP